MSVRKLAALAGLATATTVAAAPAPALFQGPVLTQDRVLARAVGSMQVTVGKASETATATGAEPVLPLSATGYGRSASPPLSWTPVPEARAYALVMEELDPSRPGTVTYWIAYNIPATVTSLGRSVHNKAEMLGSNGFMQGVNSAGGLGYIGPKPPEGDPVHHYHFEVFALDRMLSIKGGVRLDKLVAAMNDRVVAEGDLTLAYQPPAPGQAPAEKAKDSE